MHFSAILILPLTLTLASSSLLPRADANTVDILVYPQFDCRGTPQRFTLGKFGTCHTTAFTFNSLSTENVGQNMFGKGYHIFAHPNKGCTSGIGGLLVTQFRLTNGANCNRYDQGDAVGLSSS